MSVEAATGIVNSSTRLALCACLPWVAACGVDSISSVGSSGGEGSTALDLSAPVGLTAAAQSQTSIALAWSQPGRPATGYSIERAGPAGTFSVIANVGRTSQYVDNGLSPGTQYTYRLRASRGSNVSAYSNTATATTQSAAGAPPGVPTLLSPADMTANLPTDPVLTWSPSAGATSYEVQVAADEGFASLFADQTVSGTSLQVSGLPSGYDVKWRVSASSASGASDFSPTFHFFTAAAAPPPPDAGSGVTVAALSLPVGFDAIAYLPVSLTATGGAAPYTWTVSSGALPAGITLSPAGALSGTPSVAGTYTFAVRAADASGTAGEASLTLVVSHDVQLSWTASATPGVTYDVYRSGVLIASGLSQTSYTDLTVTSGSTYSYSISAVASASESAQSTAAMVSVP
jgi:hypothetical protein